MGEKNSPAEPPFGVFMRHGARRDALENFITRRWASLTARLSPGDTCASAAASSASVTRNWRGESFAPSNFATYRATAASPSLRIAASTSAAADSASSGNALRSRNLVTNLLCGFAAAHSTILSISLSSFL